MELVRLQEAKHRHRYLCQLRTPGCIALQGVTKGVITHEAEDLNDEMKIMKIEKQ